ncbi:tyrosine--tRNA ligase, mitochondrial [Copidosoma floridanum]|uniref:tyrosine--tRNA ligase, mitochondrial n=1 Tax=Copidosoma floridanum TaxID=29053 RepID=UPI0006C9B4F7|nr:tyrosine--tRNA ligase, mitochondrial [Copidosoma floridanum]XP_014210875.1 tyrosine--tRNA ligase, mitochondrial [Copidosoma floridanum]
MHGFRLLWLRRRTSEIVSQNYKISKLFYSDGPKHKSRNIVKLHERGMYQEVFPNTSVNVITTLVNQSSQCVYAGFDPTADSLHVGNLLILMNLLHWQRGGHNVIALVGGATGLIGDPSERTSIRAVIAREQLESNARAIKKNIKYIFDNHAKYFWQKSEPLIPVMIVDNNDWYKNFNVIDFVRDVGKYFRMGTMLCKSSVKSRLNSETGLSFTEFTYQMLQAYDWLHLFNQYKCKFQIGGSDQLGNISAGHELISRAARKDVYAFTLPLITAEGGKKFGKSLENAIWLSSKKSSSFDLYQFFIRTTDADVESYLKLFTFLPINQINQIMEVHKKNPDNRKAQEILADNVTLLVHGEEGLTAAKNASLLLYDKSLESLSEMTQDQVVMALEGAKVVNLILDGEITAFDIAMKANCFKTAQDAHRIIRAGGFYINYERIKDPDLMIEPSVHILRNNVTLLRTGKKTYYIVRWLELQSAESV